MGSALFVVMALAICQCSANLVPVPLRPPLRNPNPKLDTTTTDPATPTPTPTPNSAANEYLEPHNKARAEVGVNALKWSEKLAKDASLIVRYQRNNKGCQFANMSSSDRYGTNQVWSSGMTVTPRMAVETWVEEKKYYNHGSNSCAPAHDDKCGVYTQVVWGKSIDLGCAQATCASAAAAAEKATLTICYYYPPGNVVGETPY